jgi:hypothetical protein
VCPEDCCWAYSALSAEGGEQTARIPQDPKQEMPEDCDLLLRAHERDDRGALVSPDDQNPDRTSVWSSYTWKKSISNIYHPVVKVRFESGETETFTLLRGPYRRTSRSLSILENILVWRRAGHPCLMKQRDRLDL